MTTWTTWMRCHPKGQLQLTDPVGSEKYLFHKEMIQPLYIGKYNPFKSSKKVLVLDVPEVRSLVRPVER
jgi:hypothetical protein